MDRICKHCGKTIWPYTAQYAETAVTVWKHYDTEFRRCDITKAQMAEPREDTEK